MENQRKQQQQYKEIMERIKKMNNGILQKNLENSSFEELENYELLNMKIPELEKKILDKGKMIESLELNPRKKFNELQKQLDNIYEEEYYLKQNLLLEEHIKKEDFELPNNLPDNQKIKHMALKEYIQNINFQEYINYLDKQSKNFMLSGCFKTLCDKVNIKENLNNHSYIKNICMKYGDSISEKIIKNTDLFFFDIPSSDLDYAKWFEKSSLGFSDIEKKIIDNFQIKPNQFSGYKSSNEIMLYLLYYILILKLDIDNLWNITVLLSLPTRFSENTEFLRNNFFNVIKNILQTYNSEIIIKYGCSYNLEQPTQFATIEEELNYTCGRVILPFRKQKIIQITQSTSASNDTPVFIGLNKYDSLATNEKFFVNEQICKNTNQLGGKYYNKFLKYSSKMKKLI